jgi:hypothetical protein
MRPHQQAGPPCMLHVEPLKQPQVSVTRRYSSNARNKRRQEGVTSGSKHGCVAQRRTNLDGKLPASLPNPPDHRAGVCSVTNWGYTSHRLVTTSKEISLDGLLVSLYPRMYMASNTIAAASRSRGQPPGSPKTHTPFLSFPSIGLPLSPSTLPFACQSAQQQPSASVLLVCSGPYTGTGAHTDTACRALPCDLKAACPARTL